MTSEIEVRVAKHKNGTYEGFSKRYHCDRLVWFERYPLVNDSIAREKQLKGWTRVKKIGLIERLNPVWLDLSEEWGTAIKLYEWGEEERATARAKATAGPSTS